MMVIMCEKLLKLQSYEIIIYLIKDLRFAKWKFNLTIF